MQLLSVREFLNNQIVEKQADLAVWDQVSLEKGENELCQALYLCYIRVSFNSIANKLEDLTLAVQATKYVHSIGCIYWYHIDSELDNK